MDFDVIGISETWLTDDNKDLYSISNYQHISNVRKTRRGGGVSLFIADHIKFKELTQYSISNDFIECIFIEINTNRSNRIIGIVYRPPNSNLNAFISSFNDITSTIRVKPV